MTTAADHIWSQIQSGLRNAVGDDEYDLWLAQMRAVEVADDRLVLEVRGEMLGWIEDRFARAINRVVRDVAGAEVAVEVRAAGGGERGGRRRSTRASTDGNDDGHAEREPRDRLDKTISFGQFVIGDANRFAHAAALAVAEMPGQAYNPLFIYGPPGVGKTHLLHSIGNYVRAYGDGLRVRYTTAEIFTSQFLAALRAKQTSRFKRRYRDIDLLLIDDVQFLAAKARTEEEFFHTFDELHTTGSQLVLTSDRLPADLDALDERLRDRFAAGLVTAISPPDLRTRLTVLRKLVDQNGIDIAEPGVLELIAQRVAHNLRTLEGALVQVVAYGSLEGRPVTLDLTTTALDRLHPRGIPRAGTGRGPDISAIQELTAAAFGVSLDELLSDSRAARLTWPRQLAMYLAREHTSESLPAIGRTFGGRNHTTVIHACRRTTDRLASDPEAFAVASRLTEAICALDATGGSSRRD